MENDHNDLPYNFNINGYSYMNINNKSNFLGLTPQKIRSSN